MSQYFTGGGSEASDERATWLDWSATKVLEVVPGLNIQAITTDNVMVSFVKLEPNTVAAEHWHDEEQVVVVIDGELEFTAGGETRTLRRGDVLLIPPNVPHGARTKYGPCFELDIFNPPRAALRDALGL